MDEPENHPLTSADNVTGETILVVEDDSGVREITVDRLEHLGTVPIAPNVVSWPVTGSCAEPYPESYS